MSARRVTGRQLEVLAIVVKGGRVSIKDVGTRLPVSSSGARAALDALERKGMVERHADGALLFSATMKGRALIWTEAT